MPGQETVLTVVVLTVLASVVLHGFSARPLARRYGAAVGQEAQAEMEEVEEMRSADRIGSGGRRQRHEMALLRIASNSHGT